METTQYYRAMLGFCRQRAKMDGESASFWLGEAGALEQLLGIEGPMTEFRAVPSAPSVDRAA